MSTRIARRAIAVLAAGGALLLAAPGAASQANAATIYACVKKKSGSTRIVSPSTRCKKREFRLSWNTQGPVGKGGAPGPRGAKGETGAKGEVGVKGETGPAPTTMWAVVSPEGTLVRAGTGTVSSSVAFEAGTYQVNFNRDVSKCAYVATLGSTGALLVPVGLIGVASRSGVLNAVFVRTFNLKEKTTPLPFHLAVFC